MNHNFKKVFSVFKKNYTEIPLQIFKKSLYKLLISTLLSSRTKDEVTLISSQKLFQKAPTIKSLDQLSQLEIRNLIYPVGFYLTKAKHLKALARMIIANYEGKIPITKEGLLKLPGVGRKTVNLVLNSGLGIPAIAVDTHVHKISNLLRWVRTKSPLETEKELVRILPKKYWGDTNRLFVSIGRQFYTKKRLVEFLEKEKLL